MTVGDDLDEERLTNITITSNNNNNNNNNNCIVQTTQYQTI